MCMVCVCVCVCMCVHGLCACVYVCVRGACVCVIERVIHTIHCKNDRGGTTQNKATYMMCVDTGIIEASMSEPHTSVAYQ